MSTFEITIQNQPKTGEAGWPVVALESQTGTLLPVRSESTLQLNLAELLQLTRQEYGLYLGQALFQGEIRDAFISARTTAESIGQPLRLLLFVEATDLHSLHWERLNGPLGRQWDFLILDQ